MLQVFGHHKVLDARKYGDNAIMCSLLQKDEKTGKKKNIFFLKLKYK